MHIGLVTPGFSATPDDWALPVLRNFAGRIGREHTVEVYSAAYPRRTAMYRVDGVPVHTFGLGSGGRVSRWREMRSLAEVLEREHERNAFDVLHGFWANQGGLVAAVVGRRLGIPSLVTVMAGELSYESSVEYGQRGRFDGTIARRVAKSATACTVLSSHHQQRLIHEQHGLTTVCLPFGVDTARFNANVAAVDLRGAPAIVVVASLTPVKGQVTVLQALERVVTAHSGVHVHFVGEGPDEQILLRAASRLGVRDNVTFHGVLRHDQLAPIYRGAQFCLNCSHFETSGLVVLEAGACARLTVGSDVGSMSEITDREFLTRPGDAAALAEVIERLIAAPEECRRLGEQSAERVDAGFTLEQMTERYVDAYARLTRGEPLRDYGAERSF